MKLLCRGLLRFYLFSIEKLFVVLVEQVFQNVFCDFHHWTAILSGCFRYHPEVVPRLRDVLGKIIQETFYLFGRLTRDGESLIVENSTLMRNLRSKALLKLEVRLVVAISNSG